MAQIANEKKFYKHKIANLLNVQKIVTIHYQEPEKNYVSKEEKHDFWEIIYADRKDVLIVSENANTLLKQGEMIFIQPNLSHHVECIGENNLPEIVFFLF